jgi:hypothetical protein
MLACAIHLTLRNATRRRQAVDPSAPGGAFRLGLHVLVTAMTGTYMTRPSGCRFSRPQPGLQGDRGH